MHAHTQAHSYAIWGPWTNGAKSEHTHTHKRILMLFEDHEPMELKVNTHTQAHSYAIWGPWTNGAKSGHTHAHTHTQAHSYAIWGPWTNGAKRGHRQNRCLEGDVQGKRKQLTRHNMAILAALSAASSRLGDMEPSKRAPPGKVTRLMKPFCQQTINGGKRLTSNRLISTGEVPHPSLSNRNNTPNKTGTKLTASILKQSKGSKECWS